MRKSSDRQDSQSSMTAMVDYLIVPRHAAAYEIYQTARSAHKYPQGKTKLSYGLLETVLMGEVRAAPRCGSAGAGRAAPADVGTPAGPAQPGRFREDLFFNDCHLGGGASVAQPQKCCCPSPRRSRAPSTRPPAPRRAPCPAAAHAGLPPKKEPAA